MFYNVRTVLTSLQINHRMGLFVGKIPFCYWRLFLLQCQCLTYLLFFIPGLWGFYLSDPYCVTRIATWWAPNNIYVVFFFAVISGVVCRVCRVFSYHSEININIQTWYIFSEFEKVNVVLVRTVELMHLFNRLKKWSKCPFYVYFVCLFCVYVPVDCKTLLNSFAQCSWYLDY